MPLQGLFYGIVFSKGLIREPELTTQTPYPPKLLPDSLR